MHPTLMYEIARYRQADMLREAEGARLAYLASLPSDAPRRRFGSACAPVPHSGPPSAARSV